MLRPRRPGWPGWTCPFPGTRCCAPATLYRYFPGDLTLAGDVRANTHNKLLLMAPAYDRHGTVGFRCVADAPVTT